jgi:hypothetical protein
MARYRWYSIGHRPHGDGQTIEILGWSRDQSRALAVKGTIAAYYASSRQMAARAAKRDRGFDIKWRKFPR